MSALRFFRAFEREVPAARRVAVHELLALAHDKRWSGDFGVWREENRTLPSSATPPA